MKKLLLLAVCCMLFCGCKDKEKEEALEGTWIRNKLEYLGLNVEYLTFEENNKFTYKKRLWNWDEKKKSMEEGYHIYSGTYKINKNIISLNIINKDTSFEVKKCELCDTTPPSEKLIIDFNLMKICERDEGLDCKYSYSKDTD